MFFQSFQFGKRETIDDRTQVQRCRSIVKRLQYLAVKLRPVIIVDANMLGRYAESPKENLWLSTKKALRYLKEKYKRKLRFNVEVRIHLAFTWTQAGPERANQDLKTKPVHC